MAIALPTPGPDGTLPQQPDAGLLHGLMPFDIRSLDSPTPPINQPSQASAGGGGIPGFLSGGSTGSGQPNDFANPYASGTGSKTPTHTLPVLALVALSLL